MIESGDRWVLDSSVMAWLRNEPGSDQVPRLLTTPSVICWAVGEALIRRGRWTPPCTTTHASASRMRDELECERLGDLKVLGRLSLALELDAILLTGDSAFCARERDRTSGSNGWDGPNCRTETDAAAGLAFLRRTYAVAENP